MGLRPAPANWFEIVVPIEDAEDTIETLARHGNTQFEWSDGRAAAAQLPALRGSVSRYHALAKDYSAFWPRPMFEERCCELPVEVSAETAIKQIERWREAAIPCLDSLRRLRAEHRDLRLWQPVLASLIESGLNMHALAEAGPVVSGYCLVLPDAAEPPEIENGLRTKVRFGNKQALLGIAPRSITARLCDQTAAAEGECLTIPTWFAAMAGQSAAELPRHKIALEHEIQHLEQELRNLADLHGLDLARGILERIDWFQHTAEGIQCDSHYCWITGWTSERNTATLNRALRKLGIVSSLRFAAPPMDLACPSVTQNPGWLQPFEVYTQAVGVPGVSEADPTTWVAFLMPLMFGYMCGDVGHGLVIIAAGIGLRQRTNLWPLLVFCGLASAGFGLAYGDLFGYEQIIDPLWVRPLEQPFTVLLVPIVAGALVLTLGVLLHTVESCWRGQGRLQGVADAAQLLVYWGLLLAFVDIRFSWLCALGPLLCLINRLWIGLSAKQMLLGFGQLLQSTSEMLLNTLSFARVGAFALAHAALESAIMGVAGGVSNPINVAAIVILGNLLVIVLEGLVVSIQTTRLLFFEFFIRFFEGSGRRFQPASAPPAKDQSTKDS